MRELMSELLQSYNRIGNFFIANHLAFYAICLSPWLVIAFVKIIPREMKDAFARFCGDVIVPVGWGLLLLTAFIALVKFIWERV